MLRIKIAIIDSDKNYVERLAYAFNTNYQDKLEVYSFTDIDVALNSIITNNIDVLLAAENIEFDTSNIPKKCAFAYFTEMNSVNKIGTEKAICKYQKVDLIYKEILSLFSEVSNYSISVDGSSESQTLIKCFISFAGGVGVSTLSAAYAVRKAKQGLKEIYLNLENMGGAGILFSGDGNMNLSDVIYSVKGKSANLPLKIESAVKRNEDSVNFIDSSNLPLDVAELKKDDLLTLINTVKDMHEYNEIILDFNFKFDESSIELLKISDEVILVSDGSDVANEKTVRGFRALKIFEQQRDLHLTGKSKIFYNRFSSKTSRRISDINIDVIGGTQRYEGYQQKQIIDNLSQNAELDKV